MTSAAFSSSPITAWIVDPESRSVEAYTLTGTAYALTDRVTAEATPLPPFSDLVVDPASIWY